MVVTGEIFYMEVTFVLFYRLIENISRDKIRELRENVASNIHILQLLGRKTTQNVANQKIKDRL